MANGQNGFRPEKMLCVHENGICPQEQWLSVGREIRSGVSWHTVTIPALQTLTQEHCLVIPHQTDLSSKLQ